jgi:hypothetical protein
VRPRFRIRYTKQGLAALRGLKAPTKLTVTIKYIQAGGKRSSLTKSRTMLPLGSGASPSTTPSGSITSVAFTGNPKNPSIVVRGKNLGSKPQPNPAYHPAGHSGCPSIANDTGYDYGTSLYVEALSRNFSGGRYRPELNELDCVDLVVTKFTSTEVDFHFGPFLTQNAAQFPFNAGDSARVVVNDASRTVRVSYP